MKVHLNQIPPEGLHIKGEDPSKAYDFPSQDILEAGPVHYSLDVGLSDGGLFATGRIAVDLKMQCVSCLQAFDMPVELTDFALQTELEGPETVDLTPFVREDTLLALPAHPRCDWDGSRICPGPPGGNRTESGTEASPAPDTWAALDQLKIKKSK